MVLDPQPRPRALGLRLLPPAELRPCGAAWLVLGPLAHGVLVCGSVHERLRGLAGGDLPFQGGARDPGAVLQAHLRLGWWCRHGGRLLVLDLPSQVDVHLGKLCLRAHGRVRHCRRARAPRGFEPGLAQSDESHAGFHVRLEKPGGHPHARASRRPRRVRDDHARAPVVLLHLRLLLGQGAPPLLFHHRRRMHGHRRARPGASMVPRLFAVNAHDVVPSVGAPFARCRARAGDVDGRC
mmetsp:Transcript_85700/g.247486  ORF Transcript_85700/g.247486 Transcript_85700/m.247486 type:complete len:238 (-) Transcript_85700:817-1530(-)